MDAISCPCCGRALPPGKRLAFRAGLYRRGILEGLGGQEREILLALADCAGRTAGTDYLIARLWPIAEPKDPNDALKVRVCRLRKLIKGSGVAVETARGRGYRLRLAEDRGQRAGDREQRTENRGQRAEDRGQNLFSDL